MSMRAVTKVKLVKVPSIEELNAILFDMQEEMINIVDVKLTESTIEGDLYFMIIYHIQYLESIKEDGKQEHISDEKI